MKQQDKQKAQNKEKPYPGLLELTANFLKSATKIAASGFETVSESSYQARLNTCSPCPFLDKKDKRCTSCGCWVEKKAAFKVERCPEGKWKKHD
jgi:hypothetical protein